MTSASTLGTAGILELLDQWRHFPAYQLERRADIFFALYLPGIVEHALGVKVDPRVIPEFPIKRADNNQSTKVDYFLLSEDRTQAFLVEFKTEMESRNARQDECLAVAKDRGLIRLLSDIPVIAAASKQEAKYVHLLVALEGMGLVTLPAGLNDYAFPSVRRGITKLIQCVQAVPSVATVELVYLQPQDSRDDRIISFTMVAEYLTTLDDPFAKTFAQYVTRWIEPAATHAPST